jgi:hypothetical protein
MVDELRSDGYFRCACCGIDDMGSVGDAPFCDACKLCECDEDTAECRMCIVDGSHGIYAPQVFAQRYKRESLFPVPSEEAWNTLLAGPVDTGEGAYWDIWAEDIDGRVEFNMNGKRWVLEQDGDLFAVCVGKAS